MFLSATVYDQKRTLLRIYPNGQSADSVTAWSNLNFNYFCGFFTYRAKNMKDGTVHDYELLMGVGNLYTRQQQELAGARSIESKGPEIAKISELPDLADGGPSFVVVAGDANSPAMDTLEQIHDLYRKEGVKMEAAYHAREKARAERKAYLLANPPKPDDITVQFWKRTHPSPQGVEALEGGTRP